MSVLLRCGVAHLVTSLACNCGYNWNRCTATSAARAHDQGRYRPDCQNLLGSRSRRNAVSTEPIDAIFRHQCRRLPRHALVPPLPAVERGEVLLCGTTSTP